MEGHGLCNCRNASSHLGGVVRVGAEEVQGLSNVEIKVMLETCAKRLIGNFVATKRKWY